MSSGGFGGSGGGAAPDASTAAIGGTSGREGQGGVVGISGGSGRGEGAGGAASVDAGNLDAGARDAGATPPDGGEGPACVASVEVCDGIDNDCDGVPDELATCVAECDGFAIAGKGYMFCVTAVSRAEALGRCDLEGMHLAWIESAEEERQLLDNIVSADVVLPAGNPELLTQIGASDALVEGSWVWVGTDVLPDGFQFWQGASVDDGGGPLDGAYAHWHENEPNNQNGEDCALISVLGGTARDPGHWDDRSCTAPFPFVCERD